MHQSIWRKLTLLVMLVGFSLSCQVTGPALGIFTSPTATASQTATPSATSTPTQTSTPTPTPTPAAEMRLDAAHWALFIGDWTQAMDTYQDVILQAQDPQQIGAAQLGLGKTWLQSGSPDEAVQALTEFLDAFPEHPQRAQALYLRAQALLAAGMGQEALADFDAYLSLEPALLAADVHEQVGDVLRQLGAPLDAIMHYERAIAAQPGNLYGLRIKIGHAYMEAGDFQAAFSAFDLMYQSAQEPATKAAMNLMAGRALEAGGDTDGAFLRYLDSVANYPEQNETYIGLIDLVNAGIPVDEYQRGLVDYYAAAYEPALAAFERHALTTPSQEGFFFRGMTKLELGDFAGAGADFAIVIDNYPGGAYWEKAWMEKAWMEWSQLSDGESAIASFLGLVQEAPESELAPEALFHAGRIAERLNDLARAAQIWRRIPSEYPQSSWAFEGGLLAGVSQVRAGLWQEALDTFLLMDAIAQEPWQTAAARLWIGKAQAGLGDLQAAEQAWGSAAASDPTGYYSLRAEDLLTGKEMFAPLQSPVYAVDMARERAQAEDWLRETFAIEQPGPLHLLSGVLESDPRFQRGQAYYQVGKYAEAKAAFEALRAELNSDPLATYQLMHHLLDLGLYQPAIFAARSILSMAGMDDAATLDAPVYFNHIRFGAYFQKLVMEASASEGLDPMLLFAVIRQESLFEPFITSYAEARGLMQVIPDTGQAIAAQLAWPADYSADDLYRAVVSTRFGAHYLAEQLKLLDGDVSAALSAYNAGPGNALVWKDLAGNDPDLYLEIVRFDQPRRYIRSIYEFYRLYQRFYSSDALP